MSSHRTQTATSNLHQCISPATQYSIVYMTCFTTGFMSVHCLHTVTITATLFPPQSESEGFSHFHLYVCAAFLLEWRKEILSMVDFQVSTSVHWDFPLWFIFFNFFLVASPHSSTVYIHWSSHSVVSKVLIAWVGVIHNQASWCRNSDASQADSLCPFLQSSLLLTAN